MFDYPSRVRRVSHVNRVSSKNNPAKFLAVFVIAAAAAYLFIFDAGCVFASGITDQKVIEFANADRKEKGLGDLAPNEKLAEAAMAKAEDMTAKNYFAHTSPEGATPWHWIEKENYDYNYAGENLAMDFVSAEKMNRAWLDSPTHRANIMNEKYKDIGVAVKEGIINGHQTIIVVQDFGSGDKNAPAQKEEKKVSEKKESGGEKIFPKLPLEKEKSSIAFFEPVITSPQKGESISKRKAEIFGRAKPGSKVDIFDRGNLIASCAADSEGWFRAKASDFSEGEHILKAESAQVSAGGTKEVLASGSEVAFSIDTAKPKLRYKLLADSSEKEMIFRISSDKTDCVFEVGGEKIFAGFEKSVYASIKKDELSVSISAKDEAGNKAFREINLAGYYQRRNDFDIVGEFAAVLAPEKVFAAESGQEAIRNNLGLVPRQIQLSQVFR